MWRRILVATGGSPWSDAAVTYAAALAVDTGAEVCLLTVLSDPMTFDTFDGDVSIVDRLLEGIEREGKERLDRAVAYGVRSGVVSTTVLKWGSIPNAILRTADEEHCDVIILGSRRQSGWKRRQLGRIANAVVAKAHQPVLIVKQDNFNALDMPHWRRLLVATGGSTWSDAALTYALSLAQEQLLDVCVLHVGSEPSHPGKRAAATEANAVLAVAEARAAAAGVACESLCVRGHIAEAILNTATRKHCDAIVLGSRGLPGWKRLMVGRVANAVSAKATLPVLIVKHDETRLPPLRLQGHKVLDDEHGQVRPCGHRTRDMTEERPLPAHDPA